MKRIVFLVLILGLLAAPVTAIAGDYPCGFLATQSKDDTTKYYLNILEISHIKSVIDQTVKTGTRGRWVVMVVMTHNNVIEYGRYTNEQNRRNAIDYIREEMKKCNVQRFGN